MVVIADPPLHVLIEEVVVHQLHLLSYVNEVIYGFLVQALQVVIERLRLGLQLEEGESWRQRSVIPALHLIMLYFYMIQYQLIVAEIGSGNLFV